MITIELGILEYYDTTENKFIYDSGGKVRFEYSLKAIYEWESKWLKPFLKSELTHEEWIDFYISMALDPIDIKYFNEDVTKQLSDYIQNTHTATTFSETNSKKKSRAKIYTAEELYALMISANVPLEFETRNLNRLLIILRIIGSYNEPPKKMAQQDIYKQNASLNAQRKAQMKTKG